MSCAEAQRRAGPHSLSARRARNPSSVESHAVVGGELVGRIEAFAHLAPAVRASHERWDGGGYPDGLAGETIPLAARIIAACDTYEAMVTDRPYRSARTAAEAHAELRRVAGTQLDAGVVAALLEELRHPAEL